MGSTQVEAKKEVVCVMGSSPQICTKGHQRKICVKSYLWGQRFLFYNILLSYVVEKGLGHLNLWVNMRKTLCLAFFCHTLTFKLFLIFHTSLETYTVTAD